LTNNIELIFCGQLTLCVPQFAGGTLGPWDPWLKATQGSRIIWNFFKDISFFRRYGGLLSWVSAEGTKRVSPLGNWD